MCSTAAANSKLLSRFISRGPSFWCHCGTAGTHLSTSSLTFSLGTVQLWAMHTSTAHMT